MKNKLPSVTSNNSQEKNFSANESIFKKIFRGIILVGFGIIGTLFVVAEKIFGDFKLNNNSKRQTKGTKK